MVEPPRARLLLLVGSMLRNAVAVLVMSVGFVGVAGAEGRLSVGRVAHGSTASDLERSAYDAAIARAVARVEAREPGHPHDPTQIDVTVTETEVVSQSAGRAVVSAKIQVVLSGTRGSVLTVVSGGATVDAPTRRRALSSVRADAVEAAVESVVGKARRTLAARAAEAAPSPRLAKPRTHTRRAVAARFAAN